MPTTHVHRSLVIDDDRAIWDLLSDVLAGEGFEVRVAANGQQGLAILRAWRPDLIVLDLAMPVMDGWTFLAERRRERFDDIPVIVLSATLDQRRQGGDGPEVAAALSKPCDLGQLLDTIGGVIARSIRPAC